jgi:hypothetical protein
MILYVKPMPWADPYYGYIQYREDTREMYALLRKRFDENRVKEKKIQEGRPQCHPELVTAKKTVYGVRFFGCLWCRVFRLFMV